MISQQSISANTPMGATLVAGGGSTFRTWAPRVGGLSQWRSRRREI
jgi:hypothetical protein